MVNIHSSSEPGSGSGVAACKPSADCPAMGRSDGFESNAETETSHRSLVHEMVSKDATMFSSIESPRGQYNPSARGYHAVYHDGEVNHCPGCGRTHWLIGRV